MVVDEVYGFCNFDQCVMIGFVDGIENLEGCEVVDFMVIGDEDVEFVGGSYVFVQKYLYDMVGWNVFVVEMQECIIGWIKLFDIEFLLDVKLLCLYSLLIMFDEDGQEVKILCDNMLFGCLGVGEFGIYFIGYVCLLVLIEQMFENMFVGWLFGNYDCLLDYSCVVIGLLFFVLLVDLFEVFVDCLVLFVEVI